MSEPQVGGWARCSMVGRVVARQPQQLASGRTVTEYGVVFQPGGRVVWFLADELTPTERPPDEPAMTADEQQADRDSVAAQVAAAP